MNKELLHGILEKVASNNATDVMNIKKEIENLSVCSDFLPPLSWDEIMMFFICMTVEKAGYTDIYGE